MNERIEKAIASTQTSQTTLETVTMSVDQALDKAFDWMKKAEAELRTDLKRGGFTFGEEFERRFKLMKEKTL